MTSTASVSTTRVHIRWMIRRDLPEVLDIEQQSSEFPWCEETFLRCLRQRNCIGMVSECDGQILGFMIYELHKTRLHVLNLAVRPDVRRRRIAAQMIEKLKSKLSNQRRARITLEVRESALGAHLFLQSQGFRAIRVLREHFADSSEDAYWMHYRCPVTAPEATVAGRPRA